MKKLLLAVLQNEVEDDHRSWLSALDERKHLVEWEVIDLTAADWLERIRSRPFDGLLAKPSWLTNAGKKLYDERVSILNSVLGIPVYPSLEEIRLLENKKYFSYWLDANDIPHPETKVFYHRQEALHYLEEAKLPLVAKTNIGASGRGVQILKNLSDARQYVNRVFSGKGTGKSVGPNFQKKGILKRALVRLANPRSLSAKLQQYRKQGADVQRDYVILQAFVPHEFEWRVVRIGESFFAHKKLKVNEKASGTLLKGYENPPLDLLDFVREITDRHHFLSQAVDVFEPEKRGYLVNEMQCIFGQSDPWQMLVDGQPGRYIYTEIGWQFETGDFNRHQSFLLRLDHFIEMLSKQPATIQP